jgi:hypothetical protein
MMIREPREQALDSNAGFQPGERRTKHGCGLQTSV